MKSFEIEDNLNFKRPLKPEPEEKKNRREEAEKWPSEEEEETDPLLSGEVGGDSISGDPDLGHLEAEKILEEKRLAKLQADEDAKHIEELRKNMEEDREDAARTNRRF